jgi:hypothetical protein
VTTVAFYRWCIWGPVLIPGALILVVNLFGLRDLVGVAGEVLAYSLLYGGIPYIALAIWATGWVGGRSESEIRRLMFRAPLLMLAAFVPLALLIGLVVGAPGPFAGVAVLGGAIIILLGYSYVGLAVILRAQVESWLGQRSEGKGQR